jgi:hypothetical protein
MAHGRCMMDTEGYKQTLTECVIFIAFPLQQSLHERASMLRYTHVHYQSCYQRNLVVSVVVRETYTNQELQLHTYISGEYGAGLRIMVLAVALYIRCHSS